jgi:hypothetical protein
MSAKDATAPELLSSLKELPLIEHKQSQPLFQKYLHGIADVLANCLPRFRFDRQRVLPVTHSHKRCLEWMIVDLAADFDEPFGSENFAESGQTTYVQPPRLGLFSSLAVKDLFSMEPMVSRGERSAIFPRFAAVAPPQRSKACRL